LLQERALRDGIEVLVAAGEPHGAQLLRSDAAPLSSGIRVAQREYRFLGRRLVMRDTSAALRGADLVVLEQARRNVDSYEMLARRRSARPMVSLWGHGRDYTRKRGRLDRTIQSWLTTRCDWFFAYTDGGARAVVEQGCSRDRITVVQNSIDTSSLAREIASLSEAEIAKFTSDHDLRGKTALFIGALDESKRLDFLLASAMIAKEGDRDFRLLVAGDGPQRGEIARWAGRFDWLGFLGPIRGREKALAMRSSQVLAIPGRVGLVAVDSFAAGLPIVTTTWPWHAPEFEYLRSSDNAVITTDSVRDYASGLNTTLGNPAMLHRLSSACLQDRASFTVEAMADKFLVGISLALEAGPR